MGEGRPSPHFAEEKKTFSRGEVEAALAPRAAGVPRAVLGEVLPLSRAS